MSGINTIQPKSLEDALFAMASEDSEFDIWITTPDGRMHGMEARDAIQLSTQGGKGPDRFRDRLMKVWFFREYVETPNKLGTMSYHSQPDDGVGNE